MVHRSLQEVQSEFYCLRRIGEWIEDVVADEPPVSCRSGCVVPDHDLAEELELILWSIDDGRVPSVSGDTVASLRAIQARLSSLIREHPTPDVWADLVVDVVALRGGPWDHGLSQEEFELVFYWSEQRGGPGAQDG